MYSCLKVKPLLVLVALMVALSIMTGCGSQTDTSTETEISVNTARAEVRDIVKGSRYSGTVRSTNEVYIMPKIPARVTAVYLKPGDVVKKGQTILALDNKDVQAAVMQAQAAKRAADVQYEAAASNYERVSKLHEAGAISAQQLESAKSGLDSARAGRDQAQAALVQAQNQLDNCTITSPIDGVVGSINLSLGETANPQSPAAIVGDPLHMEVEVMVSESEISYIKEGSEAEVLIKAARELPFKGRVENVSTVADPFTRNFAVKVALGNEEGLIKSGMFAEVTIPTISRQNVVCVPRSAVVASGARTVVYTVDDEKRAREKEVVIGIENSDYVEIVSGLSSGEEVITKGNTLVRDGTLVRIITGGER
ncbi:MAG: efflux RND transporter periplasmic adaptor subunit [Syntrophomonadaceae bacterium]